MILTKEQTEKRLNSEKNIVNINKTQVIIKNEVHNLNGRPGVKNLSEEEKISIGVLSHLAGDEIAGEMFGVSTGTAHRLRSANISVNPNSNNGMTSSKNMSLQEKINARLETTKLTIQERAAEKLLGALGLLDNDKLANSSAKELAQITNQMSQVVRNMTSQNEKSGGKSNVRIVLHQPKPSREDLFDCVEIGVSST